MLLPFKGTVPHMTGIVSGQVQFGVKRSMVQGPQ